jgi:hypothetical protein
MASLAPTPARTWEERPRRPRPPSRKAAVNRQRRMAGSVVWIGVIAVLLAGIVAVNVAVLRLNLRLDDLSRERARLQADNAAKESQLASAASSGHLELAAKRAGLVPADQRQIRYIDVTPSAR